MSDATSLGAAVDIALSGAAGYLAASLAQYGLHRGLGHHRAGGWFFRRHVGEHHTIYDAERVTRVRYARDERGLTAFYLVPAAGLAWAAFAWLPRECFVATAAGVALAYGANVGLHAQYHRERPRLARVPGFARLRALHFAHHRHPNRNFAVVDLFWDRLFGTLAEEPPRTASR